MVRCILMLILILFWSAPVMASESLLTTKWATVKEQIRVEQKTLEAHETFQELVKLQSVGHINRAVNLQIKPISDMQQYGVIDYWSSPLETLTSGKGDCEDYAILKLAVLLQIGIRPDHLKFVVVHSVRHHSDHAILNILIDTTWRILDNLTMVMANVTETRYKHLFTLTW